MSVTVASPDVMPRDEISDAVLIERSLAGDETAFEEIVRRHQKRIYRVAWAILRDEAEADTVTQDTFVQAYLHMRRFEGRSGLETWLTRIAINRARDVIRSRSRIRLTSWNEPDGERALPHPVDQRPDGEREAIAAELGAAIERSVETLSAQQKMVFRMKHYEDRSLEEIAAALGLKAGTVRAHLFRAIHKIRKDLGGWLPARTTAAGE
ncbi:MAG TPA: sigma-70 family RNA polymerase sigma factor [Thermoanaerobaculia bacterium]|nr:sigma-70 family RNA polymerase sigma factor [Thermoanaerobaculia bacterium]